jgi:hypothetical protein
MNALPLAASWLVVVGAAHAQRQLQKLVASDAAQGDEFGSSVAISGQWLVVGKPQDDAVADQSGAAYVYRRVGASWTQFQKLKSSDAEFGDAFGFAVALDGDFAAVGAIHEFPQNVFDAGSVYVFEWNGASWVETDKVWASDAAPQAHFGFALALSGDRLLVGAKDDDDAGLSTGSAYVFDRVGSNWVESAKLVASDADGGDAFGRSVALAGSTALVGAPSKDTLPSFDQGAAYVFELLGTWTETDKLTASDAFTSDFFGISVALSPSVALVGASAHDHAASNAGAVYAFERPGSAWIQMQEFHALDAASGDRLAASLAISGDLALAGADADDDHGTSAGTAYAFRRGSGGWSQLGKMLARDAEAFQLLGVQVDLDQNRALVAATGDNDACPTDPFCVSGAAYVFEFASEASQYGSCASSAPCNNADTHGGCRNSTGVGAVLAASGSGSCSTDDLLLEVTRMPPNAAGLLFMGAATTQAPLGAGLRVVAGALKRFSLQNASSAGELARGPGIVALTQSFPSGAQIQPGQTWHFQCWYRDPSGPCALPTNLSNGLRIAFVP